MHPGRVLLPIATCLLIPIVWSCGKDTPTNPPIPAVPSVAVTELADLPYVGYTSPSAYESVDNKLYFFGGWTASPSGYVDSIRVFDLPSLAWSRLSFRMPYSISDAGTGIFFADHFYLTPGFTSGEYNGWGSHNRLIDVHLSGGSATEAAVIPYGGAIWDMLSCGANNKVYLFGGHDGADQTGIFEYVPGDSVMSLVATMQRAHRQGAVTFGADGWMYIMGMSAEIERFNPATRAVQTMSATLPPAFVGFAGISAIWHVPTAHAIYFALGGYYTPVQDPPIYKFDYAADAVTNTGLRLTGNVAGGVQYNVGIRDGANPYVAYFFTARTDPNAPMKLCRATLHL
jgi:hypothetical protein